MSALSSQEFRSFKLKSVEFYNHNTSRFIFELPEGRDSGLTVASCLLTKYLETVRPYTPVTPPSAKGRLDLLIKKYMGGAMSEHIHNLKPGDELLMKGPFLKFPYVASKLKHIGMVAGGSGITPMWQVMQEIDSSPNDKTKVTLIFANVTEKDILLREEFDKLAASKPDQFKVVYVLNDAPPGWKGPIGFVTKELLKEKLPSPGEGDNIRILVCGPPGLMGAVSGPKAGPNVQGELKGILKELGFSPDQVYKF